MIKWLINFLKKAQLPSTPKSQLPDEATGPTLRLPVSDAPETGLTPPNAPSKSEIIEAEYDRLTRNACGLNSNTNAFLMRKKRKDINGRT